MRIQLKVIPKSSRNRVIGWLGNRLKVAVIAAPERGKANAAVIDLLAELLGIARGRIRVVVGEAAALKTLEVDADESALAKLPPKQGSS